MTSISWRCLILLVSLALAHSSYSSPNGLTLELIPPYSPKSPLFIPNLTFEERMQMLVRQSQARVQHLYHMFSSTLLPNDSEYFLQRDTIQTPIIKRIAISSMLIEVGIGTFNNDTYKSYLLVMDTGSGITWIQCEDCHLKPNGNCYPQKEVYFPNSKSKSYIPFNPPSPYNITYGDSSNSSGFYAKETFTFPSSSSSSSHLKLPNIVFGCGTNNHSPHGNSLVAGNPPAMYLRFGTNIKPPTSSKTINLIKSSTLYAVKIIDLGVNGEQLYIDQKLFYSDKIKSNGIIVDSGSSTSFLSKGAYDIVASKLDNHFSKHKEEFMKLNMEGKLCYSRIKGAQGYNNIPGVTYYFEGGAQLDVVPEDTFFRQADPSKTELFCFAIFPSTSKLNLLGAFQQANFKFIFNVKDKTLQFGRDDCTKNG
ncbi:unnamed protein product [Lupinus luteus]|uniref:Peptidase A1 domain-containing protein n=1 Tax=Lupinus luteus TaxID=3873 RepID=A0AAV1X713_LUPLU